MDHRLTQENVHMYGKKYTHIDTHTHTHTLTHAHTHTHTHTHTPGSGGSSSTIVKLTKDGDPISTPGEALRTTSKFSNSSSGKTLSSRGIDTMTSVTPERKVTSILTA